MAKWNLNLPPRNQSDVHSDTVLGKFIWEQSIHYEICFYNYIDNEWIDKRTAKLINPDSKFIGWRNLE